MKGDLPMTDRPHSTNMSRRKALSILGIAATVAYVAPAAANLSKAKAGDDRTRTRSRTRSRTRD
jgi:hypothetical protein